MSNKQNQEAVPSITELSSQDYLITPWKNGQGTTAQIKIFPTTSTFLELNFDWRLSIASIKAANSFSNFPGYQRLLTVWKGNGIKLNQKSLLPFEVLSFDGHEKIDCTLINGNVEDLGLIYNPQKITAEMKIVTEKELNLKPGHHFLFNDGHCTEIENQEMAKIPNGSKSILISLWQKPQH